MKLAVADAAGDGVCHASLYVSRAAQRSAGSAGVALDRSARMIQHARWQEGISARSWQANRESSRTNHDVRNASWAERWNELRWRRADGGASSSRGPPVLDRLDDSSHPFADLTHKGGATIIIHPAVALLLLHLLDLLCKAGKLIAAITCHARQLRVRAPRAGARDTGDRRGRTCRIASIRAHGAPAAMRFPCTR